MIKKRLIIVDDNSDIKQPYEIAFRDSEFDLMFITSSLEALRYLDHNRADAVLIDLAMSEMDGLTLVREIRINECKNNQQPTRLAWFTARNIGEVEKRIARRHGVEEVFTKPTDPLSLMHEIKAWLSEPSTVKPAVIAPVVNYQTGAVMSTTVTALIGIVVIVILIGFFLNENHKREEAAAYRYAEQRDEARQYKAVCDWNWEQVQLKQPDIIQKPCLVKEKGE